MELAMATGSRSSSLVTGLRCRTGAAAAAFRFSSGDRRRSWRTTPVTASGRGARRLTVSAAACKTCKGKGAVECPGCKGTGKNKKNGNIFERWKCFDCQGFGLKSCPTCGKGGLTPEQRGER
ncbi:protein PHOTOSYSTEM I ASSEMBLY 2, chloroplastic-like [Miscanthus floridulus]